MLAWLRLRQFALVESLDLELKPGLCLLTGETGAGKSILVEAAALITGRRADSELVRSGAQEAVVEGTFEENGLAAADFLGALGLKLSGQIVIRRRIHRSGRSEATVNGAAVTLAQLRSLGDLLVEIHGQHQSQALLDEETHRRILDESRDVIGAAAETRERYQELAEALAVLRDVKRSSAERERRLDAVRFQLEEIGRVDPKRGEEEELRGIRARMQNAGAIAQNAREVASFLQGDEQSASALIAEARRRMLELCRFDGEWEAYGRDLDQAAATLATIASEAERIGESVTFDPEALERAEERLAALERLKRKYGPLMEDVLVLREKLDAELRRLAEGPGNEAEARALVEARWASYLDAAARLTAERRRAAKSLGEAVERELKPLALDKARFSVALKPVRCDAPEEARAAGLEDVAFLFSANPGEPLKPLSKIASGGELSRTMLALLAAARLSGGPPTAIFDEVDAGIGGRPAEAVGRRLKSLSKSRQVLCITHLPQIAAFADQHIRVEKSCVRGRTSVKAACLNEADRIEELARMVAGEVITKSALDHAKALVDASRAAQ
jgi:DNA repair protein RecN (Recombination protein N)